MVAINGHTEIILVLNYTHLVIKSDWEVHGGRMGNELFIP